MRLFNYEINLIKIEVVGYETSVISTERLLALMFLKMRNLYWEVANANVFENALSLLRGCQRQWLCKQVYYCKYIFMICFNLIRDMYLVKEFLGDPSLIMWFLACARKAPYGNTEKEEETRY